MEITRTIAVGLNEPVDNEGINAIEAQRLADACMNGDPEAIALLRRSQLPTPLAARALVNQRLYAGDRPVIDVSVWY